MRVYQVLYIYIYIAQLVKASVSQADVQRFGHNWLSSGVFLVKFRHFGLPLAQTIRPIGNISLCGCLGLYTNVEYLQSLPEETRTITVPTGYNTTY